MDHNIQDIREVRETRDPEEVNQLLQDGWVINYINHEPSRSRYVLVKLK
ncbi:hypothetical protein [Paenibacillus lutimineralis]|nr:hypothetical protein [Paenibacillus lutimineralis]